jgi:hypothetical protein
MRILAKALATSLLILGSAAPSFAQSNNGPVVTIFRGGAKSSAATASSGLAARTTNGVTVIGGMPIVTALPPQTAELSGGSLVTGNGASANAALLPARRVRAVMARWGMQSSARERV